MNGVYDVFWEPEVIPSLVDMVQKVKNGGNQYHYMKTLVSQWGLLKSEEEHPLRQSVESFWREAEKFYDVWSLYRSVANRDFDSIKRIATTNEINSNDIKGTGGQTHIFRFFQGKEYGDIDILGFLRGNSLREYQNAAIYYLTEVIKPYVNHGKLQDAGMSRTETASEDIFKITPCMAFDHLLDAMYMLLFSLLTENNQKVCPVCNKPFPPSRKDAKYCSETCYNTGKSQRYRNKIKRII
jgi:hypothetical protein